MAAYLTAFARTFDETARRFLPAEHLTSLERQQYSTGPVVGHISTQFGAGYEYVPTSEGSAVSHGSARIEDLLFGVPLRVRRLPVIAEVAGPNVTIQRLALADGFPLRLGPREASVKLIDVSMSALGWRRSVRFAELFGDNSTENWTEAKAVGRAKDEVLVAVVDVAQSRSRSLPLHAYLRAFKDKLVLVLGDYSGAGLRRLERIREILTSLGYSALLLKDVPDDFRYSLVQKVVAIGSVARFVVVDDSSKSGHLAELPEALHNNWVTVVLRMTGSDSSYMARGAGLSSKLVVEREYDSRDLEGVLRDATGWAEDRLKEYERGLATVYPWRAL